MAADVIPTEDIVIANHSSRVIPLWVNGRPPYGVATTPQSLLFQTVAKQGQSKTLRVYNAGFYTLTVGTIELVGQDAGLFTMAGHIPDSLPAGGYFDLVISFLVDVDGNYEAALVITPGNNILPYEVPLVAAVGWDYRSNVDSMIQGLWEFLQRAVRPALTGDGPEMSISASSIVFEGETEVGKYSAVKSITITNTGNSNLIIDSIAVSGDFEVIQ